MAVFFFEVIFIPSFVIICHVSGDLTLLNRLVGKGRGGGAVAPAGSTINGKIL